MSRQAKWLCETHLWPSLPTTPPTQLRWITILTHQCSGLDDGAAEMRRQHRREWLSNVDMVTLAQWRDRRSAQWHRFTWNVRSTPLTDIDRVYGLC
jgi:hypothetical protein